MQVLGFFMAAVTSGIGFTYRFRDWRTHEALILAAVQGTSSGVLHAFTRVLLMDSSPPGKEGAFSTWFMWIKVLGSLVGFAVASANPGNVAVSFGLGFCTAISAVVVLIFGNVSDFGGALAAGHVRDTDVVDEDGERGSPVSGLDDSVIVKQSEQEPSCE